MTLIKEFEEKKRQYLRKKRQFSNKSNDERQQKILNFLYFCENQKIDEIRKITQREFDLFVERVLNKRSTETKRKYLYALKEFFDRANLKITVNTSKNIRRTKERKLKKIIEILNLNTITDKQKEQILKLL